MYKNLFVLNKIILQILKETILFIIFKNRFISISIVFFWTVVFNKVISFNIYSYKKSKPCKLSLNEYLSGIYGKAYIRIIGNKSLLY